MTPKCLLFNYNDNALVPKFSSMGQNSITFHLTLSNYHLKKQNKTGNRNLIKENGLI